MLKIITRLLADFRHKLELAKYDDFTIAGYFRKRGARVGKNCRIMVRSIGSEPYLVSIGDHCTIAPGAMLTTHDGAAWIFTEEIPNLQRFGRIEIRDNCFIGARAIILPDVVIGPNSVVGAGAVVTRDVPPGTVVGGCPARPICTVQEYKAKVLRQWRQQQPQGYLEDLQPGTPHSPAYIQSRKAQAFELLRDHLENTLK